MALSRLRLRLTRGFGVAFFVSFVALDAASYIFVVVANRHDFNERLKDAAVSFEHAIRRENGGVAVDTNVIAGLEQAMVDWTPTRVAYIVYDTDGKRIAAGGDTDMVRRIPARDVLPDVFDIDRVRLESGLHLAFTTDTIAGTVVVAAATTDRLRRAQNRFVARMLLMVPLALVIALVLSYVLAGVALAPIDALGRATDAISPGQLAGRLPIRSPPDELDRLARQFNDLLDRIQALQEQSRRFLREVAHQIRTPLTLVVGESELGLERGRSAEEYARILGRVHAAASQMTHRVQDLLLLARMEAGERPPLRDDVELDSLALDATDMFRSRARTLGRHLELGDVTPCVLRGDEALLREALLELLENACRHGDPAGPVVVSVRPDGDAWLLAVRNAGAPISDDAIPTRDTAAGDRGGGLGLSILRWIASVHGGELVLRREAGENVAGLRLPAAAVATHSVSAAR